MKQLITYFVRGCLAVVPLAATVYVAWLVVAGTDQLLGISIPGLGLLIALALITCVGFLLSNVLGRKLYEAFDHLMGHVPVLKLLYTSLRDLLQTFAGEKKTTGKPVSVRLIPGSEVRILGLLTRDDLSPCGLPDHAAVYVPQSYNIGGQVLAIPRDQIEYLSITATEMLTFMISGGAAGFTASSLPPKVVPVA